MQGRKHSSGRSYSDGKVVKGTPYKCHWKQWTGMALLQEPPERGKQTLQVISEQLSEKGIPVLLMDVKGDLSGIAVPGTEQPFITERHSKIGIPYSNKGFPVEPCLYQSRMALEWEQLYLNSTRFRQGSLTWMTSRQASFLLSLNFATTGKWPFSILRTWRRYCSM